MAPKTLSRVKVSKHKTMTAEPKGKKAPPPSNSGIMKFLAPRQSQTTAMGSEEPWALAVCGQTQAMPTDSQSPATPQVMKTEADDALVNAAMLLEELDHLQPKPGELTMFTGQETVDETQAKTEIGSETEQSPAVLKTEVGSETEVAQSTEDTSIWCHWCQRSVPRGYARLRRKHLPTHMCKHCHSKDVVCYKMFKSWPCAQFKSWSDEEKAAFYRGPTTVDDVRNSFLQSATRNLEHIEEESFKGKFLPLEAWRLKGFDPDLIKANAVPEDVHVDKQLGICYRAKIRYTISTERQKEIKSECMSALIPRYRVPIAGTGEAVTQSAPAGPTCSSGSNNISSGASSSSSNSSSTDKRRKKHRKKGSKNRAKKSKKRISASSAKRRHTEASEKEAEQEDEDITARLRQEMTCKRDRMEQAYLEKIAAVREREAAKQAAKEKLNAQKLAQKIVAKLTPGIAKLQVTLQIVSLYERKPPNSLAKSLQQAVDDAMAYLGRAKVAVTTPDTTLDLSTATQVLARAAEREKELKSHCSANKLG